MKDGRLPRLLYHWDPTTIGGKIKQGRCRHRWQDTCCRDMASIGLSLQEAENTMYNREEWKTMIGALM